MKRQVWLLQLSAAIFIGFGLTPAALGQIVITNSMSAEFGRSGGGVLTAGTR